MTPATYVTSTEYQNITGNTVATDTVLASLLTAASRIFDRIHGVAPGMFAPITSTAFVFDGHGGDTLYLRDQMGQQYLLRAVTADKIEIDDDLDGTYEYALDPSDAWVRGLPVNAVSLGDAFTAIQLLPTTGATVTRWPALAGAVQITGTWGYEATPVGVQYRVIDIAHALRQRGYTGSMHDQDLALHGAEVWAMKMVDQTYNYHIPAMA